MKYYYSIIEGECIKKCKIQNAYIGNLFCIKDCPNKKSAGIDSKGRYIVCNKMSEATK